MNFELLVACGTKAVYIWSPSENSVLRREVIGDGGGVFWEVREGLGKDGELADLTMPSLI